jgi:hypothetical protein
MLWGSIVVKLPILFALILVAKVDTLAKVTAANESFYYLVNVFCPAIFLLIECMGTWPSQIQFGNYQEFG